MCLFLSKAREGSGGLKGTGIAGLKGTGIAEAVTSGFAGCLIARCCCSPLQYNKFCHIFSLKNENNLKKM